MKKLIIILALALILRLISIGEPLYVDEAFTYTVAQSPSTALHATFSAEEHPPLFNLLASFFRYLTGQVWALRLFSVFAGVATVMFAYLACRQLLSEKASLITAFLVSISPLFIKMSQQLRPYMLQPMLVFASMYFFLKAMRTDDRKAWAGYIIMAVLSGYTSHFSVLMMAALLLVAVLFKKHFKSFKNFIISEAVIALLLIPNLIYAYFQLNYLGFMAEYSPQLHPSWRILILPYNFYEYLFGPHAPYLTNFTIDWAWLPLLAISLIFFAYLVYRGLKMKRQPLHFFAITTILPLMLVWLMSFFSYMQIEPKRFLFVTLGLYAMIAYGISTLSRRLQIASLIVVVALMAVPIASFYAYDNIAWPGLTGHIEDNDQPGDVIGVHMNLLTLVLRHYYTGEAPIHGIPDEYLTDDMMTSFSRHSDVDNIVMQGNFEHLFEDEFAGKTRLWYVVSRGQATDPEGLFKAYLDNNYDLLEETSYSENRAMLYLYDLAEE